MRSRSSLLLVVVLVLSLVFSSPFKVAQSQFPQFATISGIVTAEDTGLPLQWVGVWACQCYDGSFSQFSVQTDKVNLPLARQEER